MASKEEWESLRLLLKTELSEGDAKWGITHAAKDEEDTRFLSRISWLMGLMFVQSFSSTILGSYSKMIEENTIFTLFLTTLIATGGNAGNQACAIILQRISSPSKRKRTSFVKEIVGSIKYATGISIILSLMLFLIILFQLNDLTGAISISVSLFFVVFLSVVVGTIVPLVLLSLKFNPAEGSAPVIASLLDVLGIVISCFVCSRMLE